MKPFVVHRYGENLCAGAHGPSRLSPLQSSTATSSVSGGDTKWTEKRSRGNVPSAAKT